MKSFTHMKAKKKKKSHLWFPSRNVFCFSSESPWHWFAHHELISEKNWLGLGLAGISV